MPEIQIDEARLKEILREVVREVIQDEISKLKASLRLLLTGKEMDEKNKEDESKKEDDDDFDILEFETLGL
jgi:hypothetical protein